MIDYEEILNIPPFSLSQEEKDEKFGEWMHELSEHHREKCSAYAKICEVTGEDMPALPVRLFKEYDLKSTGNEDVIKTMTSSGTTGQQVSKIFLDRETSARQTKVLIKIVTDFIGKKRFPMLIVDSSAVLKNRNMFSARGAGILGFSMLGRDSTYALDENMELNMPAISEFLEKHIDEKILLFGFTFMIWQYFVQELLKRGMPLNIDGIMIHGGGWKKMKDEAVDNDTFKAQVKAACGVDTVLNYYGMIEQTGSIFMECPCGHLHASIFSDVIIRNPLDFSEKKAGRGLIECRSLLPTSYPGHILLTEDEGEINGVDDCPCGRKGKYFTIYGRIKGAEIRGCSDTYEKR
jgi:hypothetical protein